MSVPRDRSDLDGACVLRNAPLLADSTTADADLGRPTSKGSAGIVDVSVRLVQTPPVVGLWYKRVHAFEHGFDHWSDLIGE
jgi:hypothetical protein